MKLSAQHGLIECMDPLNEMGLLAAGGRVHRQLEQAHPPEDQESGHGARFSLYQSFYARSPCTRSAAGVTRCKRGLRLPALMLMCLHRLRVVGFCSNNSSVKKEKIDRKK